MSIGSEIRRLRIERGLTQNELGERLGLGRPAISRIETGMQIPSVAALRRLAAALEVPVEPLLALPRTLEGVDVRAVVLDVLRSPSITAELEAMVARAVSRAIPKRMPNAPVLREKHPWKGRAVPPRRSP